MQPESLALPDGRTVTLGAIDALPHLPEHGGFAVLVPAFDSAERKQVVAIAGNLLDLGCSEFCCVGPEAEALHDSLDAIIEDRGVLEVVTTWDTDANEGCEDFLFAAGGGKLTMVALVSAHPEFISLLERLGRTA